MFLGASYLVGQLVHGIGSIYEDELIKQSGGQRLSVRLLLEDKAPNAEHGFSPELRARIFASAQDTFKVAESPQEIFEQCYALIVQKSLAQHTEIFLALNGLARSMLAASGIGFAAGAALLATQAMVFFERSIGLAIPPSNFLGNSERQLVAGYVVVVGFGLVIPLMHRAFGRFRVYFTESVYYNFLAWYGSEKLTSSSAA